MRVARCPRPSIGGFGPSDVAALVPQQIAEWDEAFPLIGVGRVLEEPSSLGGVAEPMQNQAVLGPGIGVLAVGGRLAEQWLGLGPSLLLGQHDAQSALGRRPLLGQGQAVVLLCRSQVAVRFV